MASDPDKALEEALRELRVGEEPVSDDEDAFTDCVGEDDDTHTHTHTHTHAHADDGGAAYVSSAPPMDPYAAFESGGYGHSRGGTRNVTSPHTEDEGEGDSAHTHTHTHTHAAAGAAASSTGASAAATRGADSDGLGFDDKWSEEYHGPRLDRNRRPVDEADEVEDAKKDAEMANAFKEEGNRHFGKGDHDRAIACYTEALRYIPRGQEYDEQRAVFYCNRAASYVALENFAEVVYDCDRALDHNPKYIKALARRASALERLKKYEDAQKDMEMWLELDPTAKLPRTGVERLKKLIADRDEKLKEEMLGKLKDMGNWVLGKFGLSMDNFKAVKDPATGSYSIAFQQ